MAYPTRVSGSGLAYEGKWEWLSKVGIKIPLIDRAKTVFLLPMPCMIDHAPYCYSHTPAGSLNVLLRELVTEFTLSNTLANTSTSLLRSLCHRDDSLLLGSWLEETDHQDVEEQLQLNSAAGSGALEHDPTTVYMAASKVHTHSHTCTHTNRTDRKIG